MTSLDTARYDRASDVYRRGLEQLKQLPRPRQRGVLEVARQDIMIAASRRPELLNQQATQDILRLIDDRPAERPLPAIVSS